jgi:hypothetical protein
VCVCVVPFSFLNALILKWCFSSHVRYIQNTDSYKEKASEEEAQAHKKRSTTPRKCTEGKRGGGKTTSRNTRRTASHQRYGGEGIQKYEERGFFLHIMLHGQDPLRCGQSIRSVSGRVESSETLKLIHRFSSEQIQLTRRPFRFLLVQK